MLLTEELRCEILGAHPVCAPKARKLSSMEQRPGGPRAGSGHGPMSVLSVSPHLLAFQGLNALASHELLLRPIQSPPHP